MFEENIISVRLGDLWSTLANLFSAYLLGLSSKSAFNPRSLISGIFIYFLDTRVIALSFLSQILLLSKAKISVAVYNDIVMVYTML